MKRLAIILVALGCLVPGCDDEKPVDTVVIEPGASPVTITTDPAPVAVATEAAVRVEVPEAEQVAPTPAPPMTAPAERFPFPVKHRDFDPHGDCSIYDDLIYAAGLDHNGSTERARYVMTRESGCLPGVWNIYDTGPSDESYGLWQINMKGNLGPDRQALCGLADPVVETYKGRQIKVWYDLFDPATNIACAGKLKELAGWSPWGFRS